MAKLPIRPASIDLVHAALDSLSATTPSGIDGLRGAVCERFSEYFVPLMFQIYQNLLVSPSLPETWSLALLNPIPKTAGLPSAQDLRPLVLQNFNTRWVACIVSLQLQDFVSAVTPIQQRGFIKGRYVFDNLWQAFGTWSATPQGIFCPVNSSKAFESVSHVFAKTFFMDMGIPLQIINLLMELFTAPICLLVRGVVKPHQRFSPASGVRQGCPLSPSIFAMLISPLAQKLMSISDNVQVLLYADDLLIVVTGAPENAVYIFLLVWGSVRAFSRYSGLHVNYKKSAVLLKGQRPKALKLHFLSTDLQSQHTYKYLGIDFGNVTSEQAFSHALQKAPGRAFAMQSWAISLPEQVMLLKLWILPLLVYPARVVLVLSSSRQYAADRLSSRTQIKLLGRYLEHFVPPP